MDAKKRTHLSFWLLLILAAVLFTPAGTMNGLGQGEGRTVLWLTASGPLTPAMHEYLKRGIQTGERQGVEAVVFQLNTPGGEINLMNAMAQDIRQSQVPVVVYIGPRGAMAASAGTIITMAGHAAAMAPETTIGAASPVGGQGEDLGETMSAKIKNDLKATVRALGARRGQKAVDFAESAIENAEAATATEALDFGLIDAIATSRGDLLQQLDGLQVEVEDTSRTLQTAGADVQDLDPSFIEQLLGMLTNPNIVFLLLAVGVQAILIEISSPGGWMAGFIGIICLALASYGLGVLPVNWFGMIFLILAFALFILDIKAPTHGALTAAGVGSLIVGALVLFNSPNVPDFQRVSIPLVVGTSIFTGAMFFLVLLFAIRAQREPVRMGQESLTGRVGLAQTPLNPVGIVHLGGEQWTAELAEGEAAIPAETPVRVVHVRGLRLVVSRADGSLPS